jgi:very-short-patch-repair endonuclease
MAKRKTEKDYNIVGENKYIRWVGEKLPKTTRISTLWGCSNNHRWETTYHIIQGGYGCPICNIERQRKTEQDYQNVGKSSGIRWVGTKRPKNVLLETWWECSEGHKWEATYSSIQQGSICPRCAIENRKRHGWDYHYLAKSRGFKWADSKLPKYVIDKTWWECEEGHKWEAHYNSIQQGSGCPICSNRVPKTEGDYHDIAKSRGFKWVGVVLPKDTKDITWWECEKGDRWKARYHDIQQGSGCPTCKDRINGVQVSKPQRTLNTLLHGSLNYPENRYRIDVAIMRNSQKIAVEYDCYYWHKGKEDYDAKRDKYLIFRGWKIIHIKSGKLLPTRKQLKQSINKLLETSNNVINLYLEDWR